MGKNQGLFKVNMLFNGKCNTVATGQPDELQRWWMIYHGVKLSEALKLYSQHYYNLNSVNSQDQTIKMDEYEVAEMSA